MRYGLEKLVKIHYSKKLVIVFKNTIATFSDLFTLEDIIKKDFIYNSLNILTS